MFNASRALLVKTSSLGDILHNMPVVSDIRKHFPMLQIDWIVEESFAALPHLHPAIQTVIPVAMRRWRKRWWASRHEIRSFCREVAAHHYDYAIDTQGLLKSALITRCARTLRCGYAWDSAREPLASLFYDRVSSVPKNLHAVERNRQLAALSLGYSLDGPADYGIVAPVLEFDWLPHDRYAVLLHATSRDDKLWSESNWISLGHELHRRGVRAVLPWGNAAERARGERLAQAIPDAICPPRLDLREAAALLGKARAAVGVDTGLSHLAAALHVPTVGIYTATDPGLTGLYAGQRAINLGHCSLPPSVDDVLAALDKVLHHD